MNKAGRLVLFSVIAGVLIVVLALSFTRQTENNYGGNKMTVGKNISVSDIYDFYYTYSTSTNPPEYLRYRFYSENGVYKFYFEKREGNRFPLTESDITASDTRVLTKEEWARFTSLIEGGKVTKRTEHTESGSSGPWLYLYWKGDKGKYQEFAFKSYEQQAEFESLCQSLSQ